MNIEQYLRDVTGQHSTKYEVRIELGSGAPEAKHVDGWTEWRNGRPKRYNRAVNRITVGVDWLTSNLPITYYRWRLDGTETHWRLRIEVDGRETPEAKRAEQALAERARLEVQRNAEAWTRVVARRAEDRDFAPEEARLYA